MSEAASGQELRLAVLLSGGGRTLANLLDTIARGELPARVAVVVSSRAAVRGVEIAHAAGIPVTVVPRRRFADVPSFSAAVYTAIDPHDVDLIVLAGFLCRLSVPPRYQGRIINIHPSLLPDFGGQGFYGERVHAAVLASGARMSGCTVHLVDDAYDAGPIIAQRTVPVLDGDTPETLAARVFAAERRLYPEVIRRIAKGGLPIDGERLAATFAEAEHHDRL